MDFQELDTDTLREAPPVMPWAKFAEWIQMGDEVLVVQNWLNRGYIPTLRIGKRLMVNVERFRQQLLEEQ